MCLKAAQNPPKSGLVFGLALGRSSVMLLFISMILAVPGVVCAQVNWPMHRANPAHSGYLPVSFDPNDFTLAWEITLSPSGEDVNPVVAADGRVFASLLIDHHFDNGHADLFALDASDGSLEWSKTWDIGRTVDPPAFSEGLVYFQIHYVVEGPGATNLAALQAYDAETGASRHLLPLQSDALYFHGPTIFERRVYVPSGKFVGLYSVNFFEIPNVQWFTQLRQYQWWAPAVNSRIVATYLGGNMTVLRSDDGSHVFTYTDTISLPEAVSPALGPLNDVILVTKEHLVSYNIDLQNVNYDLSDGFSDISQVSISKGVIYVNRSGDLEARAQSDGGLLWSWSPPTGYGVSGNIIVTDSHALVVTVGGGFGDGSVIHAVDLTTHQSVWSHEFVPDDPEAPPVYGYIAWSEGRLFFARSDGVLSALRLLGNYEQSSVLSFSSTTAQVMENAGVASVAVRRAGDGNGTVGVTVTSEDGSAIAGSDYGAVDWDLNWADGDTADKWVNITMINDGETEGSEYFRLILGDITGPGTMGPFDRTTVTIIDDETDVVRFSTGSSSTSETSESVTLQVTREGPATEEVSVNFQSTDVTATAGADYSTVSGVLTWGVGDRSDKPITVPITDDLAREDDETFSVALSEPTGSTIVGLPDVFTVTILDDERPRVSFVKGSYLVDETGVSIEIPVQRMGIDDGPISVDWATTGGTATQNVDYVSGSGTLTWVGGDSETKTFTIDVIDDNDLEGVESFSVELSNPVGDVKVGIHGSTTVSIADDEALEVRINTTTPNIQNKPAVASNLHGNSVVVWTSWNQDGWGWGIYGQRFDAAGDPVGDEFQINQTTDEDQQKPDVGIALNGSFIVVWQTDTESGTEVVARRFNASATPLADEFVVNTSTSGTQLAPKIAIDGANRSMIVWQASDPWSTGIFARVFGADGTPVGQEFGVNTTIDQSQDSPAIGGSPEGGFVVVWESWGQDDGISESVVGRRWNGVGDPIGGEFTVNTAITGDQSQPAVGVVGSGAFLVAWQDATGLDGSGYSVRGQWFDGDGVAAGSEFLINAFTDGNQRSPAVGGEEYGRVAVAWESFGQDGSGSGVFGRLLDDDGTFASEELPFNNHTDGAQYQVDIACSKSGVFWTVWASQGQDAGTEGVYGAIRSLPSTPMLFDDDFESGDLSIWSASTP